MRRLISKVVSTLFGRRKEAASRVDSHRAETHRPERHRAEAPKGPVIVRREEHTLSRSSIDEDAMKVLSRLTRHDHLAYLVGGGVRDLLLGRAVKDFDIATSAHPNAIKALFRNCRLIGRRFRLAHILFRGGKVIEVSTFRAQASFSDEQDLLIRSDNTFGTPEEDARRRDFTINGMFYSIVDFTVIDYVGGLEDLKKRHIRTIGDPNIRFREDPIRILRGIRLAARLEFGIEAKTCAAMTTHRDEIWKCAAPRILDEFVRMLNQGAAAASFPLLAELGILAGLLPRFAKAYARPEIREEVAKDLAALDAHQKPQAGLPAGLALAVLYWPAIEAEIARRGAEADRGRVAEELFEEDLKKLNLPRAQVDKAAMLLAVQSRIAQIGQAGQRRGRPAVLATKPWFAEALTLFEITQGDTPEGRGVLKRWHDVLGEVHREEIEGRAAAAAPGEAAEGPAEGAAEAGAPRGERPAGARRRSRRGGRGRGRGRGRGDRGAEGGSPSLAAEAELRDGDTDLAPPEAAPDDAPDQRTD